MRGALRVLLNGYDCLVLYLGLAWLGVLCLAWTPIAMIMYPLLSERRGRALGRYVIMAAFRVYLASLSLSRRCSFDLKALDVLRDEPPLIIAPNHPCMLDAVMVISRLPNVACVLKADLMNNIFLGAGSRLARYIRNEPVRRMVQLAITGFCLRQPSAVIPGRYPHYLVPGQSAQGQYRPDRASRTGAGADDTDRNQLGISEQRLAAVPQTAHADPLPGAPGAAL